MGTSGRNIDMTRSEACMQNSGSVVLDRTPGNWGGYDRRIGIVVQESRTASYEQACVKA